MYNYGNLLFSAYKYAIFYEYCHYYPWILRNIKAVNKVNILKVFGLTTCVQCAVKLGFAPAPHNTYNIYLMTSLLRKWETEIINFELYFQLQ